MDEGLKFSYMVNFSKNTAGFFVGKLADIIVGIFSFYSPFAKAFLKAHIS